MKNEILDEAMNKAFEAMNERSVKKNIVINEEGITKQINIMASNDYYPNDKQAYRQLARFLEIRARRLLTRGLILIGDTGVGKTIFIKKFVKCEIYPILDLVQLWKKDGGKAVRSIICPYWKKPICIDDVGCENNLNDYGTKTSVVSEIISLRYRYLENLPECDRRLTYITTNLSMENIKEKYGDRTFSRISFMCSPLTLEGNDMRLI